MNFSTFSLVARDPNTGDLAVAGGTNWFNYGRWVIHAEAGFGVLATQAETNMWYAPNGLDDLRRGLSAQQTVEDLLKRDPDKNGVFQLLVMDNTGNTFCHSGEHCHDFTGSICQQNVAVAGNTLVSQETLTAVIGAFHQSADSFPEKVIKALQSGQQAGGDIRGMKSAALRVVKGANSGKYWNDTLYDLRVDENKDPLGELLRLYYVAEAYRFIDQAESTDNNQEKITYYHQALKLDPDNSEVIFWLARAYFAVGDQTNGQKYKDFLNSSPGHWFEYWERLDKKE